MKVSARLIRIGMAVLAAAAFGSVVMFLVTWTSNPLREWMFAMGEPYRGAQLAMIAMYVLPGTFAWFTVGVGLLGMKSLWLMKRYPAIKLSWLVGATAGFFFLTTVLYELIIGTSMLDALHASNGAGYILDDGLITPLGWWSAGRRGLVAAVVAGLTAAVFLAVCRPKSKQAWSACHPGRREAESRDGMSSHLTLPEVAARLSGSRVAASCAPARCWRSVRGNQLKCCTVPDLRFAASGMTRTSGLWRALARPHRRR